MKVDRVRAFVRFESIVAHSIDVIEQLYIHILIAVIVVLFLCVRVRLFLVRLFFVWLCLCLLLQHFTAQSRMARPHAFVMDYTSWSGARSRLAFYRTQATVQHCLASVPWLPFKVVLLLAYTQGEGGALLRSNNGTSTISWARPLFAMRGHASAVTINRGQYIHHTIYLCIYIYMILILNADKRTVFFYAIA